MALDKNNWTVARLGDVCEINIGKTPSRNVPKFWGNGFPWLSISDMKDKEILSTKEQITDDAVKSCGCKVVKAETVLMSFKLSIGKIAIPKMDLFTNEAIVALPIKNGKILHRDFLAYALGASDFSVFGDKAVKGLTLNKEKLQKIPIPLPPHPTQQKIAAALDQADAVRRLARAAVAAHDDLVRGVFLEMFGDPVRNEKGWEVRKLKDLCLLIADIDHNMPKAVEQGVPFISAKDLIDGEDISFSNVKYISEEDYQRLSRKVKPQKGDIIYSRIGAKLGKAREVKVDTKFLASYSCCTIRPKNELVSTKFLVNYLDSDFCLRQIQKKIKSIGVPDLGMDEIREMKIPVPPLPLQEKFAQILTQIEHQKALAQAQQAASEAVFSGLLSEVFG
ncbi:MAG: restriction endonuclease subunit S [Saprospiraceae bacterium]